MDIRTLIKINNLIKRNATGTPAELSNTLHLSERSIYKYLKFMKDELRAPIEYSKYLQSYKYCENGEFKFKWNKK